MEPPVLSPMTAGSVGMPADPAGWLFEPKWDGVRIITRVWSGQVNLASRAGNDVTAGYPELAGMGPAIDPHRAVLDGEVVAFDDKGRPSFERLQGRMHVRNPPSSLLAATPVLYVVFDLLWLDGELLTGLPLTERRSRLDDLELKGPAWQTSVRIDDAPDQAMLDRSRDLGLEGYVGKQAASIYTPGRRTKAWTKVKTVGQREFVVGGWSEGERGRAGQIGSLAVGWVDPSVPAGAPHPFALRYAGQVGSGLNDFLLRTLREEFTALSTDISPFINPPKTPRLHFVRPEIVVEVKFTEMTTAGILRQPSLKGVRNDKDPADVGWTAELT
ncbi:MAG TPA: non-homologous end-joining DNA ligase [Acidimicrobiales bacterium]|nr:non-homologous end-joining DNA ligase [Acidimicrobiales bacterium]